MKVTFILPTVNMGGGIKVASIYARFLMDSGHRVVVISPPPPPLSLKSKVKCLLKGRAWPKKPHQPKSHFDGLDLDHRVLECNRPPTDADVPDADVVIATWWETAEWVNALGVGKGAKAYFIQHHEVVMGLSVDRVRKTYSLPLHKIVIARWLKDVMENQYGDTVVDLVPNAVNHELFFASPRGKQPRPTVGFLYNETYFKGLDVMLAAVRELKRRIPDLRAICFGEWTPSATSPLDDWVEFDLSPPQHRIREIYSQCDVWMTASRSEGFNLPAMEAMACRTPVVATRTGWPAEAIVTHGNGVLVEVDDVNGLVDGARWILEQPDPEWRLLSNAAFDTVALISWESSARLFEAALKHACERGATGQIVGYPQGFRSPCAVSGVDRDGARVGLDHGF